MPTAAKQKREIRAPKGRTRPMPDDFAAVAPLHSLTELRRIYKCGTEAVNRWCDEARTDYRGRRPADKRKRGDCAKPALDNPARRAEIDACLNCPFDKPRCGSCNRPALARKAAKKAAQTALDFSGRSGNMVAGRP